MIITSYKLTLIGTHRKFFGGNFESIGLAKKHLNKLNWDGDHMILPIKQKTLSAKYKIISKAANEFGMEYHDVERICRISDNYTTFYQTLRNINNL